MRGLSMIEEYREAAGCIILWIDGKENNKILLLRRSKNETSQHGLYELPGGKLEKKQTPKEAALSETLEESGLEVKIIRTLEPHVDDSMQKIYHGFIARIMGKKVEVKLSDEHDEYRWMTVTEALSMDAPLSHHAEYLFRLWKSC